MRRQGQSEGEEPLGTGFGVAGLETEAGLSASGGLCG
jgi:hypothetical protein